MPVQALFEGVVRTVNGLTYSWSDDGILLLTLDTGKNALTYHQLVAELKGLCSWQLDMNVVIGMPEELAEVLTIYHDFDYPKLDGTLLLVVTPPQEYFEAA